MPLAPYALTSTTALRAWLGDPDAGQVELEAAINGVSKSIRHFTGRQFKPAETAVTKRFTYDGSGILDLAKTELADEPTAITLFTDLPTTEHLALSPATATSEADWRLEPRGGTDEGTYLWLALPTLEPRSSSETGYAPDGDVKLIEVTVEGDWGTATVPGDVELACMVGCADLYRSPEGADERRLGPLALDHDDDDDFAFGLSNRVREMLRPYRRSGQ